MFYSILYNGVTKSAILHNQEALKQQIGLNLSTSIVKHLMILLNVLGAIGCLLVIICLVLFSIKNIKVGIEIRRQMDKFKD